MSPSQWGPPTWIFLHAMAHRIREDAFATVGPSLIQMIIQICSHLPCPECTIHAKQFWSQVRLSHIQTKQDLIHLLFVFHNLVNKRKRLKPFAMEQLSQYDNVSLVPSYNTFCRHFHTHGNLNLINDSFHRTRMLLQLKQWFLTHAHQFDLH